MLQCLNSNLVRVLFTCNSCLNSMLQRANSTFFVQKCRLDCFFHSCLFLFRNFSIAVLLSFILTKIGCRRFCIASILYLSLCNMFFNLSPLYTLCALRQEDVPILKHPFNSFCGYRQRPYYMKNFVLAREIRQWGIKDK